MSGARDVGGAASRRNALGLWLALAALLGSSAADAQSCTPECRKGFVCSNGTCVSACNPPCAAGETCSANLECLSAAPAPAAPASASTAPTPAAAPPPAAAAPSPAVEPPEGSGAAGGSGVVPHVIGGVAFAPRLLLSPFGSGKLECDGALCSPASGDDYDHKTDFGLGIDVLFKVGQSLRLGPGIAYLLEYDVEPDVPGAQDFTVGSDLDVSFVLEGLIEASPKMWVVPRGQVGVKAVMPAGDLRDYLDDLKADCDTRGMSGCESLDGARPGLQLGVGVA